LVWWSWSWKGAVEPPALPRKRNECHLGGQGKQRGVGEVVGVEAEFQGGVGDGVSCVHPESCEGVGGGVLQVPVEG